MFLFIGGSGRNVSFLNPENGTDEVAGDLTGEFFRSKEKPTNDHHLAPALFEFARTTTRDGLEEEHRTQLLAKYEAKGNVSFLGAPKINKEIMPALRMHPSVLKRDDFKVKEQTQVGACLLAVGTGITELLKPEVKQSLPDASKHALQQIADGIHLLADHQYRLSLARRAFIVPTLKLVGKDVCDNASVDEWLFGSDFANEVKDAQACEKLARDLLKAKPKNVPQPARQQPTRTSGPQQQQQQNQGNSKAPAKQNNKSGRAGANRSKSQARRSSSRSRSRRR